ncbi:hypothetical protein BJ165DRAFT_1524492 [Panaeolus papilionaceus]|nr:hypothetical protein BJ165DRAFT_1524492 [Panaeolus papilionaceus]
MDQRAFVIVDNSDTSITYNGPSDIDRWYSVPNDPLGFWYLYSEHHPLSIGTRYNMSVVVVFEGHSLAMMGIGAWTRPSYLPSQLAISIDPGTSSNIQLPIPKMATSRTYQQFFQTPTLEEGQHSIHMQDPDWEALDFLLLGVGPNTNLQGKTLWVDNEDSQIQYYGTSWRRNSASFGAIFGTQITPVGNSTHQASTPGDLLSFTFYGTAVSLYGTYSWRNVSQLSIVFTLDDVQHPVSFSVTDFMGDYVSQRSDSPNFLFFEAKNLTAAPHTLTMNLTKVENTTFHFDYLTYTPAFSTLATKPDLSMPLHPSSAAAPSPTFSLTGTANRGLPSGIIAAGVAGSLLLLFALVGFGFYVFRRYKSCESMPTPFSSDGTDLPPAYERKHIPSMAAHTPPIYAGSPATGDRKTLQSTLSTDFDTSHYTDPACNFDNRRSS